MRVYTYLREVSACCSFYYIGQCESLNERNEHQGKALTLFYLKQIDNACDKGPRHQSKHEKTIKNRGCRFGLAGIAAIA